MERFVVLDSWRGLAACMVALYHFDLYYPSSRLHGVPFVQHAYLFVDFFFVLSGFVMAANYQQRLLNGFGVWRFLLLRLGRLYPLHFSMLALYIALKLLMSVPFNTPHEASDTILANLLLIHSLHLYDFLTWNMPSWSISTEFYTYVIFAACLIGLRKHGWIALLVAMTAGPALIAALNAGNMHTTYDWGIIRCIYGFAAGVITWNLYKRWNGPLRNWLSGNIAEWCTIVLIFAFVSVSDKTLLSVAAPYIFALAVLIFAFEAGTASAILKLRQLTFLGAISYSIYMTHVFIAERLFTGNWALLPNLWHIRAFAGLKSNEEEFDFLGTQLWHGDIACLAYLAIIIVVSYFTYQWIEKPPRDWVRNRVAARQLASAKRSVVSASAMSADFHKAGHGAPRETGSGEGTPGLRSGKSGRRCTDETSGEAPQTDADKTHRPSLSYPTRNGEVAGSREDDRAEEGEPLCSPGKDSAS